MRWQFCHSFVVSSDAVLLFGTWIEWTRSERYVLSTRRCCSAHNQRNHQSSAVCATASTNDIWMRHRLLDEIDRFHVSRLLFMLMFSNKCLTNSDDFETFKRSTLDTLLLAYCTKYFIGNSKRNHNSFKGSCWRDRSKVIFGNFFLRNRKSTYSQHFFSIHIKWSRLENIL